MHLYVTLGLLVGAGANLLSFTAQSLYLPNWFIRRRSLAISIAFSGAGVGAIVLLPWIQVVIERDGWRASCWIMGLMVLLVLGPLNLLSANGPRICPCGQMGHPEPRWRRRPGTRRTWSIRPGHRVDWTLRRAMRTGRFWWIALAFFSGLFAWYAVQVHQTKYLIEVGSIRCWQAGLWGLSALSPFPAKSARRTVRPYRPRVGVVDRMRWFRHMLLRADRPRNSAIACPALPDGGFPGVPRLRFAIRHGPIVAEIFEGPHFGSIFGTIAVALISGGAAGPWVTGIIFDLAGSYRPSFLLGIGLCALSAAAIWIAAPRKVRVVPGRIR